MKNRFEYPLPAEGIRGFPTQTTFAWPLVQMREVVRLHYGKALTAKNRQPGPIPVYGTNGITGWHNQALGKGPTVILGRKGMGHLGVNWCPGAFWVIDTAYYTSFRTDRLNPRFFYYFTNYVGVNPLKEGTASPGLHRSTFEQQYIPLPPLNEQRRIAHFLGRLDDRIELNRQMNATLEGVAQALFKSWFVDFDPVRAKMDGRQPSGMDAATAALFPAAFEDSSLGRIPKGWEVGTLSEVAKIIDCLHSRKPARRSEGKLLLQVYNIGTSGLLDLSDPYFITDADYEIWTKRIEVSPGDLVITKTGRVGAVAQIPQGIHAAIGRNMVAIRSIPGKSTPSFLKDSFLSDYMKREIKSNTIDGTILKSLHVKAIEFLKLVMPTTPLIQRYEELISPFHSKMAVNNQQSQNLAPIRDTLLPELVSGELRVSDAEKRVAGIE